MISFLLHSLCTLKKKISHERKQIHQFGCGILKVVGPKKQDFWPKNNTLKRNHCILRLPGAPVCQKLPKLYFQSQFSMSKINGIFSKKEFI